MDKVIFKGHTKNGKEFIIRYPKITDAPKLQRYINTLSREQTFVLFQGEQLSLKEEKDYLRKILKDIQEKKAVVLIVEIDNEIVGNSGLTLKGRAENHVADFGISIAKNYRGQGLGKQLLTSVIAESKKRLPGLEIISLGVFASNDIARKMYTKFGFKQYGVLPAGLKRKGKPENHLYMFLKIR